MGAITILWGHTVVGYLANIRLSLKMVYTPKHCIFIGYYKPLEISCSQCSDKPEYFGLIPNSGFNLWIWDRWQMQAAQSLDGTVERGTAVPLLCCNAGLIIIILPQNLVDFVKAYFWGWLPTKRNNRDTSQTRIGKNSRYDRHFLQPEPMYKVEGCWRLNIWEWLKVYEDPIWILFKDAFNYHATMLPRPICADPPPALAGDSQEACDLGRASDGEIHWKIDASVNDLGKL